MRKPVLVITAFIFFSSYLFAQNSMTGDGFGGRGWYKPYNLSAGAYSAYTVCGDSDQLYSWGANFYGQLGNSLYNSTDTPVQATGINHVKFYTSGYISAVIKNDNSAWAWGYQAAGFYANPVFQLTDVKFVDAGFSHVVYVKTDGTVWAAGLNYGGALGNNSISEERITVPVQMPGVTNAVRAVAAGFDEFAFGMPNSFAATVILLADSTLLITGGGGVFTENNSLVPVAFSNLHNIVDIKANAKAVFALNAAGELYSFGREKDNYSDQIITVLGLGPTNGNLRAPTKINFPPGAAPIVAVSANNDGRLCLALDSNKNAYAWGDNKYGQLGDGTVTDRAIPTLVATDVIDIFAGENFTYILKSDSSVWASGKSGYGGDGSIWMNLPNIQRNVFTQIDPTIVPMNLCAPKVYGVVPIKLSSFTCIANNNDALLNWQSAEETNAGKYSIEYSSDGRNFTGIATVTAKGSNSRYSYTQYNVSGTAFYRLKMMDKDGSFIYSEVRVVKFDTKQGITIAPNPASNAVSIFIKNNTAVKCLQVISFDGRVMTSIRNYNNGQQIDISGLAGGIYILKTVYSSGETLYGRFIKN